jgi:hypothetical protein
MKYKPRYYLVPETSIRTEKERHFLEYDRINKLNFEHYKKNGIEAEMPVLDTYLEEVDANYPGHLRVV